MKIALRAKFVKTFLIIIAFSLFFQSLLRVDALSTNVFDLGIFSTNLFNINNEVARSIYGHVQPLMIPWGLVFDALPSNIATFVLVGFQTFTILVSIFWIFRVFGIWAAAAMLLYYPLWAIALFDFHFDHLAIPILTAFFVLCEKRKYKLAAFAAVTLVLIKEPFSLQVICCGIYLLWLSFRFKVEIQSKLLITLGIFLVLFGIFWFHLSVNLILPYLSIGVESSLDGEAYLWLGSGLTNKISTVFFRPDIWIIDIFKNPEKLKLILIIFGSLGFISLLRPAPLIVAMSTILIMLLSHFPGHYSYANHYTAGLIVPVIIAFKDGIPVALQVWNRIISSIYKPNFSFERSFNFFLALVLILSHWAFASSPISRLFWSDKIDSYSWKTYVEFERDKMIKDSLLKYIPANPQVSVSTQNSLNWWHLSNRNVYLPFPQGVIDPHPIPFWKDNHFKALWNKIFREEKSLPKYESHLVDYVVIDQKKPWFIVDKGCLWVYRVCKNQEVANHYTNLVNETKNLMELVYENDGFIILRRHDYEK